MVLVICLMDNFFIIENPASTWMFDYPTLLAAFRLLKSCGIKALVVQRLWFCFLRTVGFLIVWLPILYNGFSKPQTIIIFKAYPEPLERCPPRCSKSAFGWRSGATPHWSEQPWFPTAEKSMRSTKAVSPRLRNNVSMPLLKHTSTPRAKRDGKAPAF